MAKRSMAALYRRAGDDKRADALLAEGDALREHFERHVWFDRLGMDALALQRNNAPAADPASACLLLLLNKERSGPMLYYALVFLIVGLIAGLLGISGVAAMATQIAWVLFLIGIVLLVIHLITGTRRPIV